MENVQCLACKHEIRLDNYLALYDLIVCPECKVILEITQLNPVKLEWSEDPITSPLSRKSRPW